MCDDFKGTTWNKVSLPGTKYQDEIIGYYYNKKRRVLYNNDYYVANSIYALANTLERVSKKDVIENAEELIQAMAYMSSPRALRLLEWFDEHFTQGVSLEFTQKALAMKGDERAEILLERFNTLHKMSLLSKIFKPQRTKMIIRLMQQQQNNT